MKRSPFLLLLTAALLSALLLAPHGSLHAQDADEVPAFDEHEREMSDRVGHEYLEHLRQNGIDAASIVAEWREAGSLRAKHRGASIASVPWEYLGPKNQGGRVMGIAVAAGDSMLWYCAADGGGIWKSTDGGAGWIPLTDTLPSLKMSAIAVSPHDDQLVIGATHEGIIYRSSDGGGTWSVTALPAGSSVYDMQFDPVTPGTILVGNTDGLFRSTDNGRTWHQVGAGGRVASIAYVPGHRDQVLIAQSSNVDGNVYIRRSTDGGVHWADLYQRAGDYWAAIGLRLCAEHPNVIYAAFADAAMFIKSTDSGATWAPLPAEPVRDGYYRGFDVFAVDPGNPDVVFAGTTSIFRTTDGGASWQAGDTINVNVHVDQHGMLFPSSMPGAFIATGDGGVFITRNCHEPKLDWYSRNHDLATLQIYNCAMHPTEPDTIIVGCQDNGYDKFSGESHNWLIVGGDGFCTIYDHEEPAYFYHEYTYSNLHRADNGFTWWSAKKMSGLSTDNGSNGFYTGIIAPERADWFGQAVTMSPGDSKVLYLGTNFLYKTINRAESWDRVSLREYGEGGTDYISVITVAQGLAPRVYVGTHGGVVYRVQEESTPVVTDITPAGGVGGRVRTIVVSPADPDVAYIGTDDGYSRRGVRRTSDGGATWAIKSKGLPRAGVNRLLIDPDHEGVLYCATTSGLFYTIDAGDNWLPMPDFPNVEAWDLAFDRPSRTLLVGTYGRGAIRARGFSPPNVSAVAEPGGASAPALTVISTGGGARVRLSTPVAGHVCVALYDGLGRRAATIADEVLSAGEHEFAIASLEALGCAGGVYVVEAHGDHLRMARPCFLSR